MRSFVTLSMTAVALNKRGRALTAAPSVLSLPIKCWCCHPERSEGPRRPLVFIRANSWAKKARRKASPIISLVFFNLWLTPTSIQRDDHLHQFAVVVVDDVAFVVEDHGGSVFAGVGFPGGKYALDVWIAGLDEAQPCRAHLV